VLRNLLTAFFATPQRPQRAQRTGLQRVDAGKLLVVSSREVKCPHCRKVHQVRVNEVQLVDVLGAAGHVLHTEVV